MALDRTEAEAAIRRLDRANFKERKLAEKWLQERPYLIFLLQDAIGRPGQGAESQRRLREVLNWYESRNVVSLEAAVTSGAIDQLIRDLVRWPTGWQEEEALRETKRFVKTLHDLSSKQHNVAKPAWYGPDKVRPINKPFVHQMDPQGWLFIRANQVTLHGPKWQTPEDGPGGAYVVSLGVVVVNAFEGHLPLSGGAIFAGSDVSVNGGASGPSVIVSSGDVNFNSLNACLVIARGNVTCDFALRCHIICGKKLTVSRRTVDCLISEHDQKPLGYLRWSDRAAK